MSVDDPQHTTTDGTRRRSAVPADRGSQPDRSPRLRPVLGGAALAVATLVLGIGLIVMLGAVDVLPDLRNPFATQEVDRSRPAVLQTLTDLEEFRAASGHFEVIVDIEEDARFLPSFLAGERTLFVAVGDVDATVDFSAIGAGTVEVSDDRSSVSLTLPPAQLTEPRIDTGQSYVYDRQRGLVDRVAALFDEDPDAQRELYRRAEAQLAEAASADSRIVERAEANTRIMLERLLQAAGFETVDVRFG